MLYPQQNDYRNKLDLSGIWDFQIDPEHVGEHEGWLQRPGEFASDGGAGELE